MAAIGTPEWREDEDGEKGDSLGLLQTRESLLSEAGGPLLENESSGQVDSEPSGARECAPEHIIYFTERGRERSNVNKTKQL